MKSQPRQMPTWKRTLDVAGASVALLGLSPLLAGLALLVRSKLGSPVLFRQTRPGMNGEPFELLKFRTMTDDVDPDGALLSDEQRITEFGTWLRSTSLDELPELINVIRGEMSLVGPRPLLMRYLPLYSDTQSRRHDVLPGITGLAQISGRNGLTWDEKFALDVEYVDELSLRLDLTILARTISTVVSREGIAAQDHSVSIAPFSGSQNEAQPQSNADKR